MTEQPPSEPKGRVIPFRPRRALFKRIPTQPTPVEDTPVEGLGKYERVEEETSQDYRDRMMVNGLAGVVALVLIVGGWWIADTMARQRKDQDCVLAGKKSCATLDVVKR